MYNDVAMLLKMIKIMCYDFETHFLRYINSFVCNYLVVLLYKNVAYSLFIIFYIFVIQN